MKLKRLDQPNIILCNFMQKNQHVQAYGLDQARKGDMYHLKLDKTSVGT